MVVVVVVALKRVVAAVVKAPKVVVVVEGRKVCTCVHRGCRKMCEQGACAYSLVFGLRDVGGGSGGGSEGGGVDRYPKTWLQGTYMCVLAYFRLSGRAKRRAAEAWAYGLTSVCYLGLLIDYVLNSRYCTSCCA